MLFYTNSKVSVYKYTKKNIDVEDLKNKSANLKTKSKDLSDKLDKTKSSIFKSYYNNS